MTKELIIYGAGYPDIVKLIYAINLKEHTWEIKGFIDDTPDKQGTEFMGFPILGNKDCISQFKENNTFFINNVCSTTSARKKVSELLIQHDCQFATLIHPNVDCNFTNIGEGALILDGVTLGANVKIGKHCAVRYNAIINHDNTIGDFVFIGPGVVLGGHVHVQSCAYIGVGSIVKERIKIGESSLIGAGAVVITDVKTKTTVMGVPAKTKKKE